MDYTYEEYIRNFDEHFGESACDGDWGYYEFGIFRPVTVRRLSRAEFDQHLEALAAASVQFDLATTDIEERLALDQAFPYEVALLL